MNQDELQQIDTAFETLPQEARDFLFKGPYTKALAEIVQQFTFTEDQKKELDTHILQVLLLIEHRNDLVQFIQTLALTPDQQKTLLDAIEQKIIMPVIVATNYVEEGVGEVVSAPSPLDVLDTLKSRLTQPNTVAPADARTTTVPSAPKKIDPYRETV